HPPADVEAAPPRPSAILVPSLCHSATSRFPPLPCLPPRRPPARCHHRGRAVTRLPCPYLQADVELTAERAVHIAAAHPEVLPERPDLLGAALRDPDQVLTDLDY